VKGVRGRIEDLLVDFLDEEFGVLDIAFLLEGGDNLVFERGGFSD
jgi:hypothetical protein